MVMIDYPESVRCILAQIEDTIIGVSVEIGIIIGLVGMAVQALPVGDQNLLALWLSG